MSTEAIKFQFSGQKHKNVNISNAKGNGMETEAETGKALQITVKGLSMRFETDLQLFSLILFQQKIGY